MSPGPAAPPAAPPPLGGPASGGGFLADLVLDVEEVRGLGREALRAADGVHKAALVHLGRVLASRAPKQNVEEAVRHVEKTLAELVLALAAQAEANLRAAVLNHLLEGADPPDVLLEREERRLVLRRLLPPPGFIAAYAGNDDGPGGRRHLVVRFQRGRETAVPVEGGYDREPVLAWWLGFPPGVREDVWESATANDSTLLPTREV